MGWTYEPWIPTAKDAVRLAIGDTIKADPQLQDEEIASLLVLQPTPLAAAIAACKRLAAHYTRVYNLTIGQNKVQTDFLAGHYAELAKTLRDELLRGGSGQIGGTSTGQAGLVYAGGLSRDEHRQDTLNTDLTGPAMTKEAFSQPGTEPNAGNNDPAHTDRFFNP